MLEFLRCPEDWSDNKSGSFFHNFSPDYTIEFTEVEDLMEPYTFFYTCERGFLGNAIFKYRNTILFTMEYMYIDEMRGGPYPVPKINFIEVNNSENWFYYYNLSDLEGVFLHFLTQGTYKLSGRSEHEVAPFLIFSNETELDEFEQYLIKNQKKLKNIDPSSQAKFASEKMKKNKYGSPVDLSFLSKTEKIYQEWKHNKSSQSKLD